MNGAEDDSPVIRRTLVYPLHNGRVAQLVRALLSHSRGPGFESLRAHSSTTVGRRPTPGIPSSMAKKRTAAWLAALAAGSLTMGGCDSLLTPSVYGSLRVTVTQRDGRPIANIPVTAYRIDRRLDRGTTDADGTYTFERLPANSYGVEDTVIAGYMLAEMVRPGPPTNFADKIVVTAGRVATARLVLLKVGPGTIAGSVADPGGAGIAGIEVSLYSGQAGTVRKATTGATGAFAFTGVPFGNWGVSALRPEQFRDSAEAAILYHDNLLVDDGSTVTASFALAPCAGALAVQVKDDRGSAVPGAGIALYHFGRDTDSATTDSAGGHVFAGVACQDHGVRIRSVPIGWTVIPGRGSAYMDGMFVRRGATRTATLGVRYVTCRATLRVNVRDGAGAPVAGAALVLYTGDVAYRSATTTGSGTVSFANLPCDRDWGVYVTPPTTHTVGTGAGVSYFDGIVLSDGATATRTFVLTAR